MMPMMRTAFNPLRRQTAKVLLASLTVFCAISVQAQTKVRYTLDWRFDGPSGVVLLGVGKGYFKAEGLDVTVDTSTGSVAAIQRLAGGSHDMGTADTSALVEYLANNPAAPRIKGVYMLLDQLPATVFSLKKTGINSPADLAGKNMASPIFDAGRKAFPIFAKANRLDPSSIKWTSVDPALRETLLIKGETDAITGFYYTAMLNLAARGVKESDLNIMKFSDNGVNLYGNTLVVSPKFAAENPAAVSAFIRAFNKALKDTIADPKTAVKYVKEKDGLIDEALEERRMRLFLQSVATPATKANGLGSVDLPRLRLNIVQISDAFGLKNHIQAEDMFTFDFMPAAKERMY